MDAQEYVEALRALIGGEVHTEELVVGALPRLHADYRGYFVKVDLVAWGEILLEVNATPPHHLAIRREGPISRTLGKLGILADHKTGDPAFDDRYRICDASQEQAAKLLTPEVRSLIGDLEPLVSLELTHQEYRCLKVFKSLEEYPPQQVVRDLDTLLRFVELSRAVAGGPGGP